MTSRTSVWCVRIGMMTAQSTWPTDARKHFAPPNVRPAARREPNPLPARREVAGDEPFADQLEDPLGRALLAHADELAEFPGGQVHVLLRPAEERDGLQRLDVIRLQPRGGGPMRAYAFPSVTGLPRRDGCAIGGRRAECPRPSIGRGAAGRS